MYTLIRERHCQSSAKYVRIKLPRLTKCYDSNFPCTFALNKQLHLTELSYNIPIHVIKLIKKKASPSVRISSTQPTLHLKKHSLGALVGYY